MNKCKNCNHPVDWHRHDDENCLKTHKQPCNPTVAPYRCLGYNCEAGGKPQECENNCLNFIGAPF